MHLIVDSGSTKTLWCLVDQNSIVEEYTTVGLNPYVCSAEYINTVITNELRPRLLSKPEAIFFYGAGCSTDENKKTVTAALSLINTEAHIEVEHDLLAVARALCQHKKGIATILGTGSNSCLYDGEKIIANTPSLGYILGDEGSGSYIGKQFLADVFYARVPEALVELFRKEYPNELSYYLNKVYKEANANAFLASFCKWISEHKEHPYVCQLLRKCFADFIEKQISPYGKEYTNTIHSLGSIAFYFLNEWKEVILQYGYQPGEITQSPMEGLVQYHTSWKK